MAIAFGIVLVFIGGIVIFESVPYSPLKVQFQADVDRLTDMENTIFGRDEVIKESDFVDAPEALQRYIANAGFIGTPKILYTKTFFQDVELEMDGKTLRIDYTVYNFVMKPDRIALIESSMYGIPFDGYDYIIDGQGGMKGLFGKVFTVFNQTGYMMDKAQLVTLLAESPLFPTLWLTDYVTLEHIDVNRARATITYQGITASGIFTVNEAGEVTTFFTGDRAMSTPDGGMEYVPWTGVFEDYNENDSGILFPYRMKAIWNLPDDDLVYFDGDVSHVEYGN